MRDLDFSDGFTSASAPTQGSRQANSLPTFASDAAFVADKGGAAAQGDVYFNTTDGVIRSYSGTAWIDLVDLSTAQTLSSKGFSDAVAFAEISGPSAPASGKRLIYATSSGFKQKNSAGVESALGSGGGGGSFVWMLPDSNAPVESMLSGVPLLDFAQTDTQEAWAFARVPDDYVTGQQILLKGLAFICSATSGNVKFKATTFLVRDTAGDLGTLSDSYASTNAQVAVSGTANRAKQTGDIDLTNGSGQINSIAVAAGHYLAVKLVRDTGSETSGAAADARLLRFSGAPKFTP